MSKKIGIFTTGDNEANDFFSSALVGEYSVGLFNWYDYMKGEGEIPGFYEGSSPEFLGRGTFRLCDFDFLHVLAMGKFEGRENILHDFFRHLDSLETRVINSPSTMVSNLEKQYILDLQREGVPTIPTLQFYRTCSREEIVEELTGTFSKKFEDVVLKPKYLGERSNSVVRLSLMDDNSLRNYFERNRNLGVLAQEFVSTIGIYNERSLVYVAGNFSHAVLRYKDREGWLPSGEDGRDPLQIKPTGEELAVCETVLRKGYGYSPISRFDLVGPRNSPLLSEVEEVNPAIYVHLISSETLDSFMGRYKDIVENNNSI